MCRCKDFELDDMTLEEHEIDPHCEFFDQQHEARIEEGLRKPDMVVWLTGENVYDYVIAKLDRPLEDNHKVAYLCKTLVEATLKNHFKILSSEEF